MTNDIIQTVEEIIEFLKNCNLGGWADKYANWRQEIIIYKNDTEKLEAIYRQLYISSAPRGFLGDYPIASSIKGKFNYEAIETRRRDLVDKMISQLEKAGIKV